MDYLKCFRCGEPVTFEVGFLIHHGVSADGQFFIDGSTFGPPCRVEKRMCCGYCGTDFVEGVDWEWNEENNIVLRTKKKQKRHIKK